MWAEWLLLLLRPLLGMRAVARGGERSQCGGERSQCGGLLAERRAAALLDRADEMRCLMTEAKLGMQLHIMAMLMSITLLGKEWEGG